MVGDSVVTTIRIRKDLHEFARANAVNMTRVLNEALGDMRTDDAAAIFDKLMEAEEVVIELQLQHTEYGERIDGAKAYLADTWEKMKRLSKNPPESWLSTVTQTGRASRLRITPRELSNLINQFRQEVILLESE